MSEPEKQIEKFFVAGSKWIFRAVGVAAVLVAVWVFVEDSNDLMGSLGNAIAAGAGVAMVAYVVIYMLGYVLNLAVTIFGNDSHPFVQGMTLALSLLALFFVLDIALMGGTFLVDPAITLMTGGDWEGTYYGCQTQWVVVDDGSFCKDNR